MPGYVVSRVECVAKRGSKVACLGAAYKADIGDTRESPAIQVIDQLEKKGYETYVVDPHVTSLNGRPLASLDQAVEAADCMVILVDHKEFKSLDVEKLRKRFSNGRLIDTRGVWNNAQLNVRT